MPSSVLPLARHLMVRSGPILRKVTHRLREKTTGVRLHCGGRLEVLAVRRDRVTSVSGMLIAEAEPETAMAVTDRHWEHFAHEADMGVRGFGLTREEAFVQAALALTAVVTDPERVAAHEVVSITCAAPDDELLFVDWLNALVYEMATRNMLFSRFEIDIVENSLKGQAWGEKVDVSRHHPAVEIKGATYTALRIAHEESGAWMAQCVVDV
jgi:SHS2 domain-containing protein